MRSSATYVEVDGVPSRVTTPVSAITLQVEDAEAWTDGEVIAHLSALAARPFDLSTGPLFRVTILRRAAIEHVLVLSLHHIITDMWSVAVALSDFLHLYRLESSEISDDLPTPRSSYVDHVADQRALLESAKGAEMSAYWRRRLANSHGVLDLPFDHARRASRTGHGASVSIAIGVDGTQRIRDLASVQGTSPFVVMLATFQTLLHRYTGSDDILVGSPKANRSAKSARVLGCFLNPIVLRTDLSGDPSFLATVERCRDVVKESFARDRFPFHKIIEDMAAAHETAGQPLFNVMFAWQKTSRLVGRDFASSQILNTENPASFDDGLNVESMAREWRATPLDLTLLVAEVDRQFVATFEYATDLFEAGTVERLADHFVVLLESALADPQQTIGALPMLTEPERAELTTAVDDTRVEYDRDVCLHSLVSRQAQRTPSATAVTFADESLTYRQLDERANQLAHHLIARGVTAGDIVGIHLERSLDMVVAVLATLKSGAAYLPLDPGFPPERLEFMRNDSAAATVITTTPLADGDPAARVDITAEADAIAAHSTSDPTVAVSATDLAYVIYTSGSTGRPKGVQIEHRNVVNFLNAMTTRPGITPDDTLLSVTTLSFDVAVGDIFLPLVNGATLAVASAEAGMDPNLILAELTTRRPRLMQATATTWRMLVDARWRGDPELTIVCGGEALTRDLADELLTRCNVLWNAYGPTETTVCVGDGRGALRRRPITVGRALGQHDVARPRPLPAATPGRCPRRAVHRRRRRRPRLPQPPPAHGRTIRPRPFTDPTSSSTAPATSPAASPPANRTPRPPRQPSQDPRPPHRARRDRSPPQRRAIRLTSDRHHLRTHPRQHPTRGVLHSRFGTSAHGSRSSHVPSRPRSRLHGAGHVPPRRRLPPHPEQQDRPQRPPHPHPHHSSLHRPAPSRRRNHRRHDLGERPRHHRHRPPRQLLRPRRPLPPRHDDRLPPRDQLGVDLAVRAIFAAPTIAELATEIGERESIAPGSGSAIAIVDRSQPLELSLSQERMWFLHQLHPTATAYNLSGALRLRVRSTSTHFVGRSTGSSSATNRCVPTSR